MKIALVGGTHGNEPVGREVVSIISEEERDFLNDYGCFEGNPEAFKAQRRYVDCDLNRAFGQKGVRKGSEEKRFQFLSTEITGHYDFCIDLHTTTTNMGLTAILNNSHPLTRKAGAFLKQEIPGFKLIEEDVLNEDSTHLNRLCPAGITIEVGPVANNVLNGDLVLKTKFIVEQLLNFDFDSTMDLTQTEFYKMDGKVLFPEGRWYVHPLLEGQDFAPLKKGDPIFVNSQGDILEWEVEGNTYPFFINEAAYLENKIAFLTSHLKKGWI